jgi:hypothetical protein
MDKMKSIYKKIMEGGNEEEKTVGSQQEIKTVDDKSGEG